jgi:hypothetical protein
MHSVFVVFVIFCAKSVGPELSTEDRKDRKG